MISRMGTKSGVSGLAWYIKHELFEAWKQSRKEILDDKLRDNFNSVMGGLSTEELVVNRPGEAKEKWQSKTFVPVTKQKVVSAVALLSDILFQDGTLPFELLPDEESELALDDVPDEVQAEEEKKADKQAADATARIRQMMRDGKMADVARALLWDAAIYGEWYAQNTYRKVRKQRWRELPPAVSVVPGMDSAELPPEIVGEVDEAAGIQAVGGFERVTETYSVPTVERVSPTEIYHEMETKDILSGTGVIRFDLVSPFQIREMLTYPGYIKAAVEEAMRDTGKWRDGSVESSVQDTDLPPVFRDIPYREKKVERLRFWGRVPREAAEDFEESLDDKYRASYAGAGNTGGQYYNLGDEVEIVAHVVNGFVVRYARVEPGERGILRGAWEDIPDCKFGWGVADNVSQAQAPLNSMVRKFEDNAYLGSSLILGVKESMAEMPNQEIKAGINRIPISESARSVNDAISQFAIADMTTGMLNGIALFERFVDEFSMLPKIVQGDVAQKKKPDTAFEINQLMQNAGKYFGLVVAGFDEQFIKPQVMRLYDHMMEDETNDKGKGAFTVKATGFKAYQDKIVKAQVLLQMFQLMMSNDATAVHVDIEYVLRGIAEANGLDPDQVVLPRERIDAMRQQAMEEQQQAMAQQMQMQAQAQAQAMEQQGQQQKELEAVKGAVDKDKQKDRFKSDLAMEVARQKLQAQYGAPGSPLPPGDEPPRGPNGDFYRS